MRRIDKALKSVQNNHRQESYAGPIASTSGGGHTASVNNLHNSQVRNAKVVMPYGISSSPFSGMKAQAIVNDNSENVVVGVYDPSRPAVGAGEVCIYSSGGNQVYLSNNGDISIHTNSADIDLKASGAINIYNSNGSVNLDAAGNVGMSNSDGYSVMVGLYADESSEGGEGGEGEEQVNGITLVAGDTKVTLDGETGEIKITKEKTTGITISETNEISIFKDETAAVLSVTEENDIKLVSNEEIGVEIIHDGDVKAYNTEASATIGKDGKIDITTTNDIKLNTTGKIEFQCTEFKVNDQTMIVP